MLIIKIDIYRADSSGDKSKKHRSIVLEMACCYEHDDAYEYYDCTESMYYVNLLRNARLLFCMVAPPAVALPGLLRAIFQGARSPIVYLWPVRHLDATNDNDTQSKR